MRIAFLGTKGIPNNYGGFEQFAEYLSVKLAERGHSITVYNPSYHPYQEPAYKGVTIERIYSPENLIGSAANFIYDHLCLTHALKSDFDIIYEAGYHSVAFSYKLLNIRARKHPVLITNMDGIEWKRAKWNFLIRKLIKVLEKIAVKNSHHLISDNVGIQDYYKNVFKRDSFYLPYGADIPNAFDVSFLTKRQLTPHDYFIVVARMEPENNIEPVIKGFCQTKSNRKLVVVGNINRYGETLRKRYTDSRVLFTGGIYDKTELDSLRHFSMAYFHGHSVGGTNPSLLEAMACSCFIMAHDNAFNKAVLLQAADYFTSHHDVTAWIDSIDSKRKLAADPYIAFNTERIRTTFSWEQIASAHEILFKEILAKQ